MAKSYNTLEPSKVTCGHLRLPQGARKPTSDGGEGPDWSAPRTSKPGMTLCYAQLEVLGMTGLTGHVRFTGAGRRNVKRPFETVFVFIFKDLNRHTESHNATPKTLESKAKCQINYKRSGQEGTFPLGSLVRLPSFLPSLKAVTTFEWFTMGLQAA